MQGLRARDYLTLRLNRNPLNDMADDPSATYRGFRSQALYVLHRLLHDQDGADLVFRPEGDEDLAVYDSCGVQIEAVQIKDFSAALALSHFKPASEQGFFW